MAKRISSDVSARPPRFLMMTSTARTWVLAVYFECHLPDGWRRTPVHGRIDEVDRGRARGRALSGRPSRDRRDAQTHRASDVDLIAALADAGHRASRFPAARRSA